MSAAAARMSDECAAGLCPLLPATAANVNAAHHAALLQDQQNPSIDNSQLETLNKHDESENIVLDVFAMENGNIASSSSPSVSGTASAAGTPPLQARPTTPIAARKHLLKLNVNLRPSSSKYAETDNAVLSSSNTETYSMDSTQSETSSNSIFPHEQFRNIKRLNISFDNISITKSMGFWKRESKSILHGLTGHFRAGELSGIVGPSGAGKSTFLNILSAYTPFGYTGDIRVNGKLRDIKAFKPNVAFITQDTSLQPYLSVKEAMHFAANLKIGVHMSKAAKRERVRKILEAIGMYENRHTRTGNLSGGQKKRLSIALELVNNPPVLIMDEPTSGLDSSTSNQCISLLKKLALEGRTVICTIHQPSALTFEMFDHLYAVAEGKCIYSGGTRNLVPFLNDVGLPCPESYNPADYLMEIATNDYGDQNYKLVERIENGKSEAYRQDKSARKAQIEAMHKVDKMMASGLMTPVTAPVFSPALDAQSGSPCFNAPSKNISSRLTKQLTPIKEFSSKVWDSKGVLSDHAKQQKPAEAANGSCGRPKKQQDNAVAAEESTGLCKRENIYATPFHRQLGILLLRTFLILWRDSSLTTTRFVMHFVIALLIGNMYYGIGNDAANALNNFRYAFYTIMFVMYCAFSAILIKFPLEFPIVSREHFNRWYSLRAYYVAITLADIPIQIICTSMFIGITYWMTGQPMELMRLGLFSFMVFLTALVAQSIGLAVGASLSVQLGAILGPFFICPFLTFSGFFLQEKDAPGFMRWLFHSSFLKYSLDGSMLALFGYDRPKLECNSLYCHYARPKQFLKDLDMENADYLLATVFLIGVFLGLRILSFYIMSFRLRLFR